MSSILAFIFICMSLRMLAVFLAYKNIFLPYLGALYILFGLGMFATYMFGLRDFGVETGGKKIWWDDQRPLFGLIWIVFGICAMLSKSWSWKILSLDILVGYLLFINHHFIKYKF